MKSSQIKKTMKSKIIKSILIPTLGMLSTGVVTPMVLSSCFTTIVVQSISIDKESLTLDLNESEQLTATVLPENATNKNVSWSSSNNEVATVDKNGLVTAVGIGEATITATTEDGEHTATCEVNVADKVIHVQSISIDKESLTLDLNESEQLTATVLPENATNKNVTWNSSNGEVATVDENGKVTAVGIGEATITATTEDGEHTATCEVNVFSDLITINANSDSTLELINKNNNPNLQYSTDQENWNEYTNKIVIPKDTKLYLKGNNPNGWSFSYNNYSSLIFTGNVSVSGNVMGLLDNGAKFKEQSDITNIPCDYCFSYLFYGSTGITNISRYFLPAKKLTNDCYYSMFKRCFSLTKAPDLPATELANNCYDSMFSDCESLTKTPDLQAANLTEECYEYMFSGCDSLIEAPDLPATNLAKGCCRYMFYNCSSLTIVPDLQATELTNDCYAYMFYNCSSLTSIKIYYEGSYDSSYFSNWVNNVANNGIFYYNGTDSITNFGFSSNWTKQSFPK